MSYLPQLKEEVDTLAKNPKVRIAVAFILVCLVFDSGWLLCRHYDRTAAADGADVTRQSVKDDNQRARDSIGTAAEQIRQAGQQLDSLAESIDASERTVDENKAVIDDSRQLIESSKRSLETAESILRDIDRANQISGTQTSRR